MLFERDRDAARSRVERAERAAVSTEKAWEDAIAVADDAFDRWERVSVESSAYEDRKREALAKGQLQARACNGAITAVTALTTARRALAKLDDPGELERRLVVAREHDEFWKGGA